MHCSSSTAFALLALLVLATGCASTPAAPAPPMAVDDRYGIDATELAAAYAADPVAADATYRDVELGVQGIVTSVTEPWPATPLLVMAGTGGVDIVCEFSPGTISEVRAYKDSEIVLLSIGDGFDGNVRVRDCHIRDLGDITRATATPPYPPATP